MTGANDSGDAVPMGGAVAPGFEAVVDEFRRNFAERGEVGAALTVIHDGEVVVDVWGGWQDAARTEPWQRDTMVDVYSVGKALAATLVLQAIDRGDLTLDTAVVDVWPEFAAGGKEWVTVGHVLSHRAAVPAIREPLDDDDLFDWDTMTAALAATDPWWGPDERHTYHTNTFGHLVGEIVRRVTGRTIGEQLRDLADDLGADVWFGVPVAEQARCAEVMWDSPVDPPGQIDGLEGDVLLNVLAHFNPPGYSSVGVVNTPAWRSAGLPAAGGHGSARGVARFYEALIQPDRLVSAGLLDRATTTVSRGPCAILGEDVSFGLGFTPTTERRPLGSGSRSFGHFGTGGAVGFGDPDHGLAFGYVMNHVIPRWQSSRNRALIDTVDAIVTGSPRS